MNLARGRALTALALLMAIGCGGSDTPPNQGGGGTVIVTLPDGGTVETTPPPAPPPAGAKPPEGIFVSASKGIEGADGAMTRPVKTLALAMVIAQERKLPVIACAETYAEAVTLRDGVTMFGYFDCSDLNNWKRVAARAVIASPTSPAVLAENLSFPAYFEGFDVLAPDVTDPPVPDQPARSSYGMIVRGTRKLSVGEVTIRGGNGQDGADGNEPASGNAETGGKTAGGPADYQKPCDLAGGLCFIFTRTTGAAGGTSTCAVGARGGPGGKGGDGPFFVDRQLREPIGVYQYGDSRSPTDPLTALGAAPSSNAQDIRGANGRRGNPGSLGQHGTWTFSAVDGFVPGDGTAGGIGAPGQGGGGGGGGAGFFLDANSIGSPPTGATGPYFGATGGGGGAGGCGGIPGTGGRGGGASIGLFVTTSEEVQFTKVRIESKKGGRAGKGALGTLGTAGGKGGSGKFTILARYAGTGGGDGGNGGAAGLSGHGAPGPSIAFVVAGRRPHMTEVDLVPGQPGDGVEAIEREGQTLPGVSGIAKAEHSL